MSAYDEEFVFAKLELISNTATDLRLVSATSASPLHLLYLAEALPQQLTPTISTESFSINATSIFAQQLCMINCNYSLASRNLVLISY